jgi:hypothetical protein
METERLLKLEKRLKYLKIANNIFDVTNIIILVHIPILLFTLELWSLIVLMIAVPIDRIITRSIMILTSDINKDYKEYCEFLEDKINTYD